MHPIVEQVRPSPEQEAAVVERGTDVVVSAGAGTGKTRTLVARYLALLAAGMPLRSILAITFTNKAAREMRNRVRDEVRRYLERPGLEGKERERWLELYNQLDAARISTIHAFCSELLRAHPAEAGIDPRFSVLEEGQQALLQQQAIEDGLDWATDDAEAVELFALLTERGLQAIAASLLARRLDAAEVLAAPQGALAAGAQAPEGPALLERWRGVLRRRQVRALETLLGRADWQSAAVVLQANVADDPDDPLEIQRSQVLEAIRVLQSACGDPAAAAGAFDNLDAIRLTGGRAGLWPGGGRQRDAVKNALGAVRTLWSGPRDVLTMALNPQDEKLAAAVPALRALFRRMVSTYTQLKEERQALDYDDLEERSLALLRNSPAALGRWQSEIQAILVDEFQDTNARQRDLVACLNDGGKLTIVGDAKQSIYRFRGADAAVFGRERARIVAEGGLHCALATSYRAHRGLVEVLNNLLGPVLGEGNPERPWVEPFEPLGPEREQPALGLAAPYVELHLTVGAKSQGALDRAAVAVAGRIVELIAGGIQVREGGEARPLGYGDFAILCRASRSFAAYEDALERMGVPYLTVAGSGFYERAEVRDLLNALRALTDPADNLALAGLLRSPVMGLPDAALYRLTRRMAEGQRKAGHATCLWDLLRNGNHGLQGEEAQHADRAARLVGELHDLVGRLPVADVLKRFLDATGYRAALIAAGLGRGARNASKLLADAHTLGLVGVGEFVEYVDGLRGTGAREGEARGTADGAVQILSVHQAKGLEFPVVIVGDAGHGSGGGSALLFDPELGLVLKLEDAARQKPAAWQLAAERDRDQEEAESDRLFYVACTRAREMLLVSGYTGISRGGALTKAGGWLGRIAAHEVLGLEGRQISYDPDGTGTIRLDLKAGASPVACTIYEPGRAASPPPAAPASEKAAMAAQPFPPPILAPVAAEPVAGEPATAERVWRVVPAAIRPEAPAWVVGSLVHEALRAWRFPSDGPPGAFERWAGARARSYGLTDARQLRDALHEARRLLERFRKHVFHAEMASAEVRWHEVPYSVAVPPSNALRRGMGEAESTNDWKEESGSIDALFRRGGRWTLVEFKTDRVRRACDVELLLAKKGYRKQVLRYAAAAERLLSERPRCVLCCLDVEEEVLLLDVVEE